MNPGRKAAAKSARVSITGTAQDSFILSLHINSDHLKAARVVWDYCEESARVIFGGVLSKEQSRILEFLTEAPRSSQTIRKDLFKKNRKLEEINSDLYRLISFGKVIEAKDATGKPVYSRIGE